MRPTGVLLAAVLASTSAALPQEAIPGQLLPPRLVSGDTPAERPVRVSVDMRDGWHRRDWDECHGASVIEYVDGAIALRSDHSAVSYWQVPTILGSALPIDTSEGVRDCERLPLNHASGRIRREGDDFAAKVGIIMAPEGSTSHREIAYVWMKTRPLETVLVQEAGPFFWRYRFYRLVAESGTTHAGTWRGVERDLVADYERIWPGEKPGKLVSVFFMVDGDNTGSRVRGELADLAFRRQR